MLAVLAVFMPSFFMTGPAQSLFLPLSLAVGFSMGASYLLSSTLVPVLTNWILKPIHSEHEADRRSRKAAFDSLRMPLQHALRTRDGAFLVSC